MQWKYHIGFKLVLTGKIMLADVGLGLAGFFFGEMMHLIKNLSTMVLKNGYLIVIGLVYIIGNSEYR